MEAVTVDATTRLASEDMDAVRRRLLAADRTVLADLYDAYARRIYGLALWWCGRREEAEDVVQDTFVRVWEKRRLVARAYDLEAYLLRIAKTMAARRYRKQRPEAPLEAVELVEAVVDDPVRRLEAARLSARLHRLSPKLRAVVYLHGFLDHSFRQTGIILGIPTFTAASRYRLAIERLKRLMEVSDV